MAATDRTIPENSKENLDKKLDHAIKETFPTSDPVSVTITKGGAIDYDERGRATGPASGEAFGPARREAEKVIDKAKENLRDAAASVSESAREAYIQGRRYVRDAAERYPEAERYYREGSRAVRRQAAERPWLTLAVGIALGCALALVIQSEWRGLDRPVPDYARTRRRFSPYRR